MRKKGRESSSSCVAIFDCQKNQNSLEVFFVCMCTCKCRLNECESPCEFCGSCGCWRELDELLVMCVCVCVCVLPLLISIGFWNCNAEGTGMAWRLFMRFVRFFPHKRTHIIIYKYSLSIFQTWFFRLIHPFTFDFSSSREEPMSRRMCITIG